MPPKVVRGTIAKLAQHFGAVVGSTDATRPFKTFVVEVIHQPLSFYLYICFLLLWVCCGYHAPASPRQYRGQLSLVRSDNLHSAEWIVYKRSNDETLYTTPPLFFALFVLPGR